MGSNFVFLSMRTGAKLTAVRDHVASRWTEGMAGEAGQIPEQRWNSVIPNGTFRAGHIADVPAPPRFDVYAELRSSRDLTGDMLASALVGHADTKSKTKVNSLPFIADQIVAFSVEKHCTPEKNLGSAGSNPGDGSWVKQVCLIRRRPGMDRGEFVEYYETRHAPLAARTLPQLAAYRRSYVMPGTVLRGSDVQATRFASEIDVITEMWFRSREAHESFTAAFSDPSLAAMFVEDEANLFDRTSIQMFMVNEQINLPCAS